MTEMTVAEFMANPPSLDDLLEQVQAGDPDAVEMVKAIFAMERNNAAFAKWASDHRQQLSQFTTAMQGKVIADDRAKKSKAQSASATARRENSERQYAEWADHIRELMNGKPASEWGFNGVRPWLQQELKKRGSFLTDKQLGKAIQLAKQPKPEAY